MKKKMLFLTIIFLSTAMLLIFYTNNLSKIPDRAVFKKTAKHRQGGPKANPNANYWEMRAYPEKDIDIRAYKRGLEQANQLKQELLKEKNPKQWELAGPMNVGGRFSDIEIDPNNEDIIWAATASGGVYKTVDKGLNWTPVFDDQPILTIGALAIDPNNSNIVYVGTGEASASSFSFYGDGMYKTIDGGVTWEHIGLDSSYYISRVRVNPNNSNIVYACATGKVYSANEERGVYKSIDGGASWDKILYISDITAANDLVIDPNNSDIIYASMWERNRPLNDRISGGVTSGIYKSVNSGTDWEKLTNGFPEGDFVGRIGLAISQQNSNILYASMANYYASTGSEFGGVWKTVDGGATWTRTNDSSLSNSYSNFGWYFSKIEVDPKDDDVAFLLGVSYHMTSDGGTTWQLLGGYDEYYAGTGPHVDHHAIAISPTENFFINGNDGGLITSTDNGATFTDIKLPITQFYGFDVDDNNSNRMIGGAQDNGTNFTRTGNLDDWEHVLGGDGFRALINPGNPSVIYAEAQWGWMCKSIDDGNYFWNITDGLIGDDRFDWNTPMIFHPMNPRAIFCGSQYLYKSGDAMDADYSFTWNKISPDLTDGVGNIYAIAPAPANANVIYVGTSHSNVWVTQNGGTDWTKISTSLPNRWVTGIVVDWDDPGRAFVSYSGLRWDSELAYVYKTEDYGVSWTDVTGNLPLLPINTIEINKNDPNMIFVGTDIGLYYTNDAGGSWKAGGLGIPNSPVYKIKIHYQDNLVFAATYGRSAYKTSLDDFSSIENPESNIISEMTLSNYPNPFNNETVINISMSEQKNGIVKIYNAAGREIGTIFDGMLRKGNNKISFDAGKYNIASGLYICRVVAGNQVQTHKMNYLR
ncbi:MAG: T9SS type A sorting domain-containing protein [Candidatus Delongbacteria bacterium]|nr:T9SS type A sorting domain-containing protein [Candidatus Delongbacteria bacterium]